MERDEAIKRIKAALKRRSGKQWSVTGGRGTAWGWIKIDSMPSRCTWKHRLKAGALTSNPDDYEEYDSGQPEGHMSPAERAELGALLGKDGPSSFQGESIPASYEHRREYTARAEGQKPAAIAQPYWD